MLKQDDLNGAYDNEPDAILIRQQEMQFRKVIYF